MANPYFRNLPEFDYVDRTRNDGSLGDYTRVKNLFKKGVLRKDIFQIYQISIHVILSSPRFFKIETRCKPSIITFFLLIII